MQGWLHTSRNLFTSSNRFLLSHGKEIRCIKQLNRAVAQYDRSQYACRFQSTKTISEVEQRILAIPIHNFRNFCIVAHVDHGKSTLSDRLLEFTGTIEPGNNKQILDKLDVERERGITVKAQTCSMIYQHNGTDYLLHLIDTPGHVDFRAEVSRSYASCGGGEQMVSRGYLQMSLTAQAALLLVDATQGIQAQTVANFFLAFSQGLKLLPVINKVDLPSADPSKAMEQIKENFELDSSEAIQVSGMTLRKISIIVFFRLCLTFIAKTGLNVGSILPSVIENIPP